MKHKLLLFLLLFYSNATLGQVEKVQITTSKSKTYVHQSKSGKLKVNVSSKKASKFKANGFVRYSDFGAKGNGKIDDIESIAATHAYANQNDLTVKADKGASYYIGKKDRTVTILTDTDFETATFLIDDTNVQNRKAPVFIVKSKLQPIEDLKLASLRRGQEQINVALPGPCLIAVTDANTKRYIRMGLNQNKGSSQTDIFIVDEEGGVDPNTPIIWDFDQITRIEALPIDEETLTISGGHFTTIANKAKSKYSYYSRNIEIQRSNVVVDGLEHHVKGEGNQGAPYRGFIRVSDCANVTIKNTILTGHKTYNTIGSAGKPVRMGTYDIQVNRSLNVSFINCTQTNDINDRNFWGIMGSNYSKNLLYENCTLSRFDAHMGVSNATIRNSTLGHMGINAIGTGTLGVINSIIYGSHLVNLRSDYGSTWQGEIIIRDSRFIPSGGMTARPSLIGGSNSGQHDFGYTCYLPESIVIENLHIDDSNHPEYYQGPTIFKNFNPLNTDESYQEAYPYIRNSKVTLKDITTATGKDLRLSDNVFLFKNVKIKIEQPET